MSSTKPLLTLLATAAAAVALLAAQPAPGRPVTASVPADRITVRGGSVVVPD